MLRFRVARFEDWARIYAWRLDPIARAASMNKTVIPLAEHLSWFKTFLAHPEVGVVLVANDQQRGVDVGMLRLDVSGDSERIVSLVIDAAQRGRGYGLSLLTGAGISYPDTSYTAIARVAQDNFASLRLFTSAGFTLDETSLQNEFVTFRKEITK